MNINTDKTGLLVKGNDIKLHRQYFKECVRLHGINVIYRAPRPDKHWTTYAELESNYQEPIVIGCLFNEHPAQKTMKKLGWFAEGQENTSLIDVEYDLPGLQVGALFIVPSAFDNTIGRLFRVIRMQASMVYPASVTCELAPEYEDTVNDSISDYEQSNFNVLNHDEDDIYGG